MTVDFREYQRGVERTADPRGQLAISGLGLAGESGEVVDIIKKVVGHKVTEIDGVHWLDAIEKELGDALFYIGDICNKLGLSMGTVAEKNLEKLAKRYPNGFVPGGGIR